MEGQWTISRLGISWVHDSYDSKEEAIESAKSIFEEQEGCFVGQLEHVEGIHYNVVNQEEISFLNTQCDQNIQQSY